MLTQTRKGGLTDLGTQMQPAVFVAETLAGMGLLGHFRASGTQMVLIVDEYGEVQGLITLQDVLEAVTGEFKPRNQEDAWAVQREDGSWLPGRLPQTGDAGTGAVSPAPTLANAYLKPMMA